MAPMLYQATPSGSRSSDRHEISEDIPAIVAVEKVSISPETQMQIAALIGYLDIARQVLIQRPQLVRDLSDMITANNPQAPPPTLTNPPEMTTQVEQLQVDIQGANVEANNASVDGSPNVLNNSGDSKTEKTVKTVTKERSDPDDVEKWVNERRNTLMVVAILIASVTFQAALSPPGGVWDDWKTYKNSTEIKYQPGQAINQDLMEYIFPTFMLFDGIGLAASLSIILLLTEAIPIRRPWLIWVLLIILWVAVSSLFLAFVFGVMTVMEKSFASVSGVVVLLFIFYGLLFLGNFVRFIRYLVKGMALMITRRKNWR